MDKTSKHTLAVLALFLSSLGQVQIANADYASEINSGNNSGLTITNEMNRRFSNQAATQTSQSEVNIDQDDSKDFDLAKEAISAKDYEKAMNLLLPLAKKGYVEATCQLAEMYENGLGVPQDPKEAVKLYKTAAGQGAKSRLSVHLTTYSAVPTNQKELNKFVDQIQKDAKAGDADAQRVLGTLYFKGLGLKRDFNQSFKWYQEAAGHENPGALSNLGFMYQHGAGTHQDYRKAITFYKKAADLEDPQGANNLGFMYARGYGVPQDYKIAAQLFQKAYEQGSPDGTSNLGWLYQEGKGVTRDYNKAFELYTKAAVKNVTAAQYNLGFMYQYGYGVKRDINKAMKYYLLAAAKGNPAGQSTLSFMGRVNQTDLPTNYNDELKWYKKQAQRELRAFIHWDLLEMPD
jgi:TPR repeat protein